MGGAEARFVLGGRRRLGCSTGGDIEHIDLKLFKNSKGVFVCGISMGGDERAGKRRIIWRDN